MDFKLPALSYTESLNCGHDEVLRAEALLGVIGPLPGVEPPIVLLLRLSLSDA